MFLTITKPVGAISAVIALLLASTCSQADSAGPLVAGWLEWAYLKPGDIRIKSKLDTGARTSSIDAQNITPFERDGQNWVRFTIPLENRPDDSKHGRDIVWERPIIREVAIKEFGTFSARRYVVEISLCLAGITFKTPATLANRSAMNYPLLLGRSALNGLAIIDPAKIFTFDRGCTAAKKR